MHYKAFHKLSYGLYIVTSAFEGKKAGYIANTAFQVTSEPPQLAIACHKKNETTGVILKSGIFSISVLKKDLNLKIIGDFGFMSSSGLDKFSGVNFFIGQTGAPVVTSDSVAWLECRVVNSVDVGSHILIIGEVTDSDVLSDEEPLTYAWYRETYKMLAPKNAPTYLDNSKLEAGTITPEKTELPAPEPVHKTSTTQHVCTICGYTYNPEEGDPSIGIPPGTPFEDLPDDYRCPICNASKEYFKEI